jgi:hypothetical protein
MNLKSTILLIIGVVMMIWGTLATMQNITDALSTRTTIGTYNNGTITTKDGNVWKVTNYNGINTNKSVKVSVKFDTKGTDSVLDDEIVEITEIR